MTPSFSEMYADHKGNLYPVSSQMHSNTVQLRQQVVNLELL
jgi:hypothetical protein